MASLLPRDHERLQGVHSHLVRVVIEARKTAPFIVLEGLRSRERQAKLVALGASRSIVRSVAAGAVMPRPRTIRFG
jgi:peptidoglycan L-alanyl-D-glutamate endopeptidase CwlK